jgi:outer membrane protein
MMSKIRTTLGLVLLMGFVANSQLFAQDVKFWSLQECVNYAIENNLTVKNQELSLNVNEVNSKQARMNLLPTLNASGQYGYNWGRSINPETNLVTQQQQANGFGSLNANWTLFSGMRNLNSIKQADASLVSRQFDLEKSKNDIILNVITFYTNVIFNQELLENAKLQLESTTSQMDRTKKQVEAGSLPMSNLLDLQSQVATSELNVINAENNLNFSYLQLKQVMQIPGSQPLGIEIPEIELSEADLADVNPNRVYEAAVATMPEVKSADSNIESTIMGVKVAKAGLYPRVTLSAGMNTNYSSIAKDRGNLRDPIFSGIIVTDTIGYVNGPSPQDLVLRDRPEFAFGPYSTIDQLNDNFGQSLGIGISIPIFNNLQVNASVQRAKIAKDQAQIVAEQTRQNLRQTIERAYNDVYSSGKAYQSSIKRVEAQAESFRATKQRFDNGAANATEYELAENNLFQARSDLLRAKYDYIFKLKILDFYQGKPIDF